MRNKYIVFDNKEAICFPQSIIHADVATMQHGSFNGNWERKVPTSAGFFTIGTEISYHTDDGEHWPEGRCITNVLAFGYSESLKLDSKSTDSALIKIALGL